MTQVATRADIQLAAGRIAPYIRLTPVINLAHIISDDWTLWLKLENFQVSGAFKARGAFNTLLENDPPSVVAASGGNFGIAIAYAAHELGVPATIFVPDTSPVEKTRPIAEYGADLRLVAGYYDEALVASRNFVEQSGGFLAHAFDQYPVVCGQGTIGSEVEAQVPHPTTIMVPVGGGGLIAGIAGWFRDDVRVIGIESEECSSLHTARGYGGPTQVDVGGIAASSLGAREIGEHAWAANKWIDHSALVDEKSILDAQAWLWEQCRVRAEPAAAVALAALRSGEFAPDPGETVVAVVSGANV